MSQPMHAELSRRESQIMDAVYRLGEATAEAIRAELPDAPSNSSVRKLLSILEDKGHLEHRTEGRRYVYFPSTPPETARRSALMHLVDTFFDSSASKAAAALLSMSEDELSGDDLDELSALIEQARDEDRS